MSILRRLAPSLLFFSMMRPVKDVMQRARKVLILAAVTLVVALVSLVIIAVAALLWIVTLFSANSSP